MTLYEILQVTEKAEKEVIASAYKGLVKKYHPDVSKSPDAERKMAEINNAYAVLSDPVKRSAYDQKLQSERNARNTSTGGNSSQNNQTYNAGVKKEYVRPQPPKTEQKRKTEPPPEKTTYQYDHLKHQSYKDSESAKKLFRNINENISNPFYYDLGIYSSLTEDGNLEIIDVGKRSIRDQISLIVGVLSTFVSAMILLSFFSKYLINTYGDFKIFGILPLSYFTMDSGPQTFPNEDPLTGLFFLAVFILLAWATFVERPKRYKIIVRNDNLTIFLHKFFRRTFKYKKIFYAEVCNSIPPYLKIHFKNGRKIKTLKNAHIIKLVHEIIGLMIKDRV